MLFADEDPAKAPWWVVFSISAVTVALAVLRAYDYYKKKSDEWRGRQIKTDAEESRELTTHQKQVRRDATDEAFVIVDRLTVEIKSQNERIEQLLEREKKCNEERAEDRSKHATVKAVLRIVVAWAGKQKNPPIIPTDIMEEINSEGSGAHIPLQEGRHDHR